MCKINGKKLAEIRTEKGISQNKLASEIGKSSSAIGKYEANLVSPSDETVNSICMILNIDKSEIEDDKNSNFDYSFLNGMSKIAQKIRNNKKAVKNMTPQETESWITAKRTYDHQKADAEIKAAMKNAFGIGSKKYILIDPTLLHIPTWQRNTDMTKVTEIAENFNEDKFDPIKAYLNNGKLEIADGAHRLIAFILKGEVKILVEVLNCDEQEAMFTFLGQQAARKAMSISDMYRAGVKAKLPEYVEFKNFFEGYNIQISVEDEKIKNPIGKITPSRMALRRVVRDRETLDKTVRLIKRLEWCGSTDKNAFTNRNFAVFKKLYANYGDSVEGKLIDKCSGVVFFESKVAPIKSNAELYDMLSAIINK